MEDTITIPKERLEQLVAANDQKDADIKKLCEVISFVYRLLDLQEIEESSLFLKLPMMINKIKKNRDLPGLLGQAVEINNRYAKEHNAEVLGKEAGKN